MAWKKTTSAMILTTGIVGKFGDDERRLCGCLACHHCQDVGIPWKTSIEGSRRLREGKLALVVRRASRPSRRRLLLPAAPDLHSLQIFTEVLPEFCPLKQPAALPTWSRLSGLERPLLAQAELRVALC